MFVRSHLTSPLLLTLPVGWILSLNRSHSVGYFTLLLRTSGIGNPCFRSGFHTFKPFALYSSRCSAPQIYVLTTGELRKGRCCWLLLTMRLYNAVRLIAGVIARRNINGVWRSMAFHNRIKLLIAQSAARLAFWGSDPTLSYRWHCRTSGAAFFE